MNDKNQGIVINAMMLACACERDVMVLGHVDYQHAPGTLTCLRDMVAGMRRVTTVVTDEEKRVKLYGATCLLPEEEQNASVVHAVTVMDEVRRRGSADRALAHADDGNALWASLARLKTPAAYERLREHEAALAAGAWSQPVVGADEEGGPFTVQTRMGLAVTKVGDVVSRSSSGKPSLFPTAMEAFDFATKVDVEIGGGLAVDVVDAAGNAVMQSFVDVLVDVVGTHKVKLVGLPWKEPKGIFGGRESDDGTDARIRVRGHIMKITANGDHGIHSGRRRFRVHCVTCKQTIHESTTSATARIEQHVIDIIEEEGGELRQRFYESDAAYKARSKAKAKGHDPATMSTARVGDLAIEKALDVAPTRAPATLAEVAAVANAAMDEAAANVARMAREAGEAIDAALSRRFRVAAGPGAFLVDDGEGSRGRQRYTLGTFVAATTWPTVAAAEEAMKDAVRGQGETMCVVDERNDIVSGPISDLRVVQVSNARLGLYASRDDDADDADDDGDVVEDGDGSPPIIGYAISEPGKPVRIVTWGQCPICLERGMRTEPEGDEGAVLIHCTNVVCGSNGGGNLAGTRAWWERTQPLRAPASWTTDGTAMTQALVDIRNTLIDAGHDIDIDADPETIVREARALVVNHSSAIDALAGVMVHATSSVEDMAETHDWPATTEPIAKLLHKRGTPPALLVQAINDIATAQQVLAKAGR